MKKSRYGRLSIIVILIATLFVSAAIAIFGLAKTNSTGANSSAVISAPEKEASSAIANGEITDDGTISAPEVEAKAAATYSSLDYWNTAVASSGNTLNFGSNNYTNITTTYTVPSGITLTVDVGSSTLSFTSGGRIVVNGTLNLTHAAASGSGTITCTTAATGTDSLIFVNSGGTLSMGSGVTLNGNNTRRCVRVFPNATFNMTGGSITLGTQTHGGGVYSDGNFTMSGGVIDACKTVSPGWTGGGVTIWDGKFKMTGGTIAGNTSQYGGGVYVYNGKEFEMTGGYIYSNTATIQGGGVYVDNGAKFTKSNGYIGKEDTVGSGNNAPSGAGVALYNATFTHSGGEIDLNTATSYGGAVYVNGESTLNLSGGYFDGNKASQGGAVYVANTATLNMTGGYIGYSGHHNTASNSGGGVYVYSGGKLKMSKGTIQYNDASGNGGGVYLSGSTSSFIMEGGTISNNTAVNGGGVYWIGSESAPSISFSGTSTTSTKIYSNTATGYGGGIYAGGSRYVDIGESVDIYSNKATNGGGGIYVSGGRFRMVGGKVRDNQTTGSEGDGGGILFSGGDCSVMVGEIYHNTSARNGGGIRATGSSTKLAFGGTSQYPVKIYDNTATSGDGYGGGISVDGISSFSFGNTNEIYNNTANYGGGIHSNVAFSLDSGGIKIHDNTANRNGGGIYKSGSGTLTISMGQIYNNKTTLTNTSYGYGGGIWSNTAVSMSGGYIYSNQSIYGGGVFMANNAVTFTMSGGYIGKDDTSATTNGNSATRNGGGVYVETNATFTKTGGNIEYNKALGTEGASYGFGGGVACIGTFNMTTNTTNYIRYNTAYCGGGVSLYGSTAKTSTFSAGTIGNNTVTGNGGGVHIGGSKTLAMNSTGAIISDNTATNANNGRGGGVYISAGTFNFTAGYIRKNNARIGGGVYYGGGAFTYNGGTIGGSSGNGNTATQNGGGVYTTAAWTPTKGTISYNKVTGSSGSETNKFGGGGVGVGNSLTLNTNNVIISNNEAANAYGGGIGVVAGSLIISGGYIRSNYGCYGGGVAISGDATFSMSGGTIGGSSSYSNGSNEGCGVWLGTTGTCTISGGTISYNGSGYQGGGILIQSGTTLNHTGGTVSNNSCYQAGGIYNNGTYNQNGTSANVYNNRSQVYGGGIYNAGTYTLTNGNVGGSSNGNSSNFGGGVYNTGTMTINGGSVSYNTVTRQIAEQAYAEGGGIWNSGILYVNGGTIANNTSTDINAVGGGIYSQGNNAYLEITAGNIRSNTATQNGGGVFVYSGAFTMTGGTIGGQGYANNASYGGGLYIASTTAATFSSGTVSYNTANEGAGICLGAGATLNMSGTAVVAYNSGYKGAGIILDNSSTTGSTLNLSGGQIYKNSAYAGGGVYVENRSTLNITGGTIGGTGSTYANTANVDGGGVYVDVGGTLTMSAGLIAYNDTSETGSHGGGVVNYGTFTLSGTAELNHNAGYSGGGVYTNGTFNMEGGTITGGNSVYGGGVYVAGGTFNLTGDNSHGGIISYNSASQYGGGVYVNNGAFNMSHVNAKIENNTSTYSNGGGVYVAGGTTTFTGGRVQNNTAAEYGGGAYVNGGTLIVASGSVITNNKANKYGGGAYINGGALVLSGVITENEATLPYGAGVYINGGELALQFNAVVKGNLYKGAENNVFVNTASSITFAGKLTEGAEIGITAIEEELILTRNFTTAGHVEADIEKYFDADIHGLHFHYINNEVVITYTIADAWNETVQASLDNNSQEVFVLYKNWTPDAYGSFGTGVGFYGAGMIWVPTESSVLFDNNGFDVDRNETSGSAMRIEGTLVIDAPQGGSIKGGNAENGGAIYIYGGQLTLTKGTVSDNVASYGGAIYVDGGGEFTLDGGTIVRNHAENGGAIYVKDGVVTISSGTIGGSAANKNEATSYGGAIYVAGGGIATVEGGTVSYNNALSGSAVYVNGGRLDVSDGNIGGNSATENGTIYVDSGNLTMDGGDIYSNTAENGGAIYVAGGNVTLTSGSIEDNTATLGSGLYVVGGTVTLEGVEIIGNMAENGAGVYITGGSVVMTGGSVSANEADENGGGVYVTGTAAQFTISGGEISDNYANDGFGMYINGGTVTITGEGDVSYNASSEGGYNGNGGVYLAAGTLNVTGGKIYNNRAQNGGGVYVAGGEFKLSGGEIYNNRVNVGGGVYVAGGTFNMTGGEIYSNRAMSETMWGAGVYNESTATLSGGKIDNNAITTTTGLGGGVYNAGTLNVSGTVEISDNKTANGAGIYNVGTLTVSGGSIINNTTQGRGNGGGIYSADGTVEISDGLIDGNAAIDGAGVYLAEGTLLTVTGGTLSNNVASGNGGGVYVANGGELYIYEDTEISGNTAVYGGGVYADNSFEMTDGLISANKAQKGAGVYLATGTFELTGGEISENIGAGATTTYGGGVYVATDAELTVGIADVIGNTATYGGGVYVEGNLTLRAGTISENSAASGGGVYVAGGSATMTGGEIIKNSSTNANVGYGGGGVFVSSGSLSVSGSAKINENSAARYGGGIRIDGTTDSATVEISDGELNGNTATYGGGAYVGGAFANLTLSTAAMVSENTATTAGGGVAVASGATLDVKDNAFITDNAASLNGGGVYLSDTGSKLNLQDKGAITYNTANYGGGVYVTASGAFTMDSGALSYNEATANGGAVYVTGATFTLNDGEVLGNAATANGGAVYVAAGAATAFVMNGGIIGREALESDVTSVANVAPLGGGVYIAGGNVTLTSGEIKGNEATENGGGVYFNAGTLSVKGNPVIENNIFQNSASNLYLYNGKTINVIGNLTEGAHIGVTATGQVTVGYSTDNGEDEKDYFFGDVEGAVVVINVGEIYLQISLKNAWSAAVQTSLDKGGKEVTFVLAETWRATDGSFGEGVGFTDDGALYLPSGAYIVLNLNGYTINRNLDTAIVEGSVFYVEGSLKISGTTGYITGGNSENGGAVTVKDGGYLELTIGNIQNNTATENGGGVYVSSGARFKMTGGAVRGNTAKNGGAVYVENGGTLEITGGTIGGTGYANSVTENGGAIYTAGIVTLTGGTVTLNTATENGGAVYVAGGECNLAGGTVSRSSAKDGAGVYVAGGELAIDGTTLSNNVATGKGGGVYVAEGSSVVMGSGELSTNRASDGGAVYNKGTATLTGGKLATNTASNSGGGVWNGGTLNVSGTVEISGNNAGGGAGIMISGASAEATVSGGKIINNTAVEAGGGILVSLGKLTMTDGLIDGNNGGWDGGGGVYVTGTNAKFTLTGGTISGNTTNPSTGSNGVAGGVYVSGGSAFDMNGGEISGNSATYGGGVYVKNGTATLTGGKISGNTATQTGGGIQNVSTLGISGTVEISGNTAGGGAGVMGSGASSVTTVSGGQIINNIAGVGGGGITVMDGATLNMTDGLVNGNVSSAEIGGGGAYVYNATFKMTGGEISGNTSEGNAGGIRVDGTTSVLNMTGGEISGNTGRYLGGGVYMQSGTFKMTGGTITANSLTGSYGYGGGVYVANGATFEIEGSPMIYGNTSNGVENNVYLVANKTITITGMLSIQGLIAYVGVTMADPSKKKFTTGFTTGNDEYDPELRPETVFFSDNTDYMVGLEDGEAALVANDYSQTSLIWQISKDGENTWMSIDVPTFSLRYKAGETYSVRALDAAGVEVEFTWATDSEGNDVDAGNFAGIGSYKFVINSDDYLNPSLTVEILPATLYWQYSTDGGSTWFDLTVDTMVYTGAEYKIRAIVYDTNEEEGYKVVKSFNDDTMKDVGVYVYEVEDAELYDNATLNFTITTRYITVEWNFSDALGNATSGYYWEYDGQIHSPIAVLNGVSNELAGVSLRYDYDWSGGYVYTSAQSFVGDYTLTVSFLNADPNVVLSNTTVEYTVKGVTLTLTWVDEHGNEGDEFEFEFDNEKHGVDFILNGVVTGDTVGAYITYASRSGKILSEAPTAVGYYTATVKLPADCYNYVFDRTYVCQIVITQKEVDVQWQPNKDGSFEWTFNGLGQGPTATITDPYTGAELNEPYKIEYAPVASNGNIGQYTTNKPVNAGNYIVRLTLNNPDANYVLGEGTTQLFKINKLDVEITWSGADGYDADKGVYYWYYDGNEHDLEAEISLVGLAVNKDGVIIPSLDIERTDARVKLVSVGSATATVVLLDDPFNANFNITNSTSQVYEVRKAVITDVQWTDKLNQKFESSDKPEYDFGSVSGINGPAFVATALNGTVTLEVTYNKTYAGDWVVDETVGYIAYARLSADDAANYEFAEGAEYATITFLIKSVGGYKTDIDVTWVVFINEHDYVLFDRFVDEDGEYGGFVYNGKVQSPTPIYIKENGIDYEVLELQPNSIGADAGSYIARLKPSSVYNIKEKDFTRPYEIKKLDIEISWQDGQYDSNTSFAYIYNGSVQAPYAYVSGNYDFEIAITVNGKTNAGTFPATAVVSNNFNIVSGKTQVYTIKKVGLDTGLIVWDYVNAGASGNAKDGWYWIYDGEEHAPIVTIPAANWGGEFDIELVVTGKTSEIGTHAAYAVLNSSIPAHNNFYLTGTAETTFEIVQVKAGKVYWEDASGHTYEDGKGGDTGLVYTYNGNAEGLKPKAYYLDDNNEKVYLTVTVIGNAAVDAGTYTAYVSSELDFNSALPTCTFTINPMELTVKWDKDTALTFNGTEQHPAVTLSKGVNGLVLKEGEDYEVTGYTKAGNYTAEIKFINTNYTCAADAKTFEFEIGKLTLSEIDGTDITEGFAWSTAGYDEDNEVYVWTYDGNDHAPVLTVTYTIDGEEVEFEIGYLGVTSAVGKHKVTAYVKSATLGGKDITENFVIEAEMEYEIVSVSVSIEWVWGDAKTGTDEDGNEYYYWEYDGTKHAPKAYLIDADGNRIQKADGTGALELDVYGGEINARDDAAYTLTAVVPSEYNFTGDNTQKYFVKKATIEVIWDFGENAEYDEETGVYTWTYGTAVEPKAYVKVTKEDGSVEKGAELENITGFETDAGTHVLTVMQNDGNYKFAEGGDATVTYVINPQKVYVVWYGNGGIANEDTENFEWTYGGENTVPTAYLAYKDGEELKLLLDENGDAIPVEVSGASNEIGTHTAQVVDTFVNYVFADDATTTHPFKIEAKDLAANKFKWTAEGAKVSEDGLTFTYEYNGENNLPVPSSNVEDLGFNIKIEKVNADGTTEVVLAITEVGTYKVTATSQNGNYKVPEGKAEITVTVNKKTVKAQWDESKLVYNGDNQKPQAYYEDVDGNMIELEVTVTGDSANAGTTYTATATLDSNNYVLDEKTTEKTFKIEQKEINVEWTWTDVDYDGKDYAPAPLIKLTGAEKDGITNIVYEITDKDGNVVAHSGEKVKDAGEYKMTVTLKGPAADNYKLDKAEYTFNIYKKVLTVTATGDKQVVYGNSLTLTMGDVTFEGFIDGEEDEIKADLEILLDQWLICHYTNRSLPGEYTIYVDSTWLNEYLNNYAITAVNGKLTVKAAAGKLLWKADKYDDDGNPVFTYNGEANLPKAFYYDAQDNKVDLEVKLANLVDGEYVVKGGEAVNASNDYYYAVIVDGEGNVIKEHGSYTFENYGVKFTVEKREIVININELKFVYGDENVTEANIEALLGFGKGWSYGETEPVAGDVLGITLTINGTFDKGGYLVYVDGGYEVTVGHDESYDSNYTFAIDGEKKFIVEKAEITVKDYDGIYANEDEVYTVYDDNGILKGTDGYISEFVTKTKDFLNIAGYQDAEIEVKFSERFDADGDIPDVYGYRFMGDEVEEITTEGKYVYLFRIEIDNHETLYGQLIVDVKFDDYYLSLEIVKNKLTERYGYAVPEDLATWLIENGYAKYDEEDNAAVSKDTFLSWVTATVYDENGEEKTGKLSVGTYKVVFGLSDEADDRYSIYKASSRTVTIEITKGVIDIDWGNEDNLNYTYDGEKHVPVITVAGIIDENGNPKTLDIGENEIVVNGETVKVIVTVDGDFTEAGAYSVLVTVDSENFEVSEDAALRSVAITEPVTVVETPVPGEDNGNDDWKLWLIIAAAIVLAGIIIAIVIAAVKRRKMGDDDGFYDPVDESDL